uniref:Uncharacterized protein n=1 Tax=Oryza nivara TaxID=4536 RepID=A0A0E0I384_ORYNI
MVAVEEEAHTGCRSRCSRVRRSGCAARTCRRSLACSSVAGGSASNPGSVAAPCSSSCRPGSKSYQPLLAPMPGLGLRRWSSRASSLSGPRSSASSCTAWRASASSRSTWTITTNILANVVAPANALVSLSPLKFTFAKVALVTALLGIAFQPWRLFGSSESFIYTWPFELSSATSGRSAPRQPITPTTMRARSCTCIVEDGGGGSSRDRAHRRARRRRHVRRWRRHVAPAGHVAAAARRGWVDVGDQEVTVLVIVADLQGEELPPRRRRRRCLRRARRWLTAGVGRRPRLPLLDALLPRWSTRSKPGGGGSRRRRPPCRRRGTNGRPADGRPSKLPADAEADQEAAARSRTSATSSAPSSTPPRASPYVFLSDLLSPRALAVAAEFAGRKKREIT